MPFTIRLCLLLALSSLSAAMSAHAGPCDIHGPGWSLVLHRDRVAMSGSHVSMRLVLRLPHDGTNAHGPTSRYSPYITFDDARVGPPDFDHHIAGWDGYRFGHMAIGVIIKSFRGRGGLLNDDFVKEFMESSTMTVDIRFERNSRLRPSVIKKTVRLDGTKENFPKFLDCVYRGAQRVDHLSW